MSAIERPGTPGELYPGLAIDPILARTLELLLAQHNHYTTIQTATTMPAQPPPHSDAIKVSFPRPHIMLLTLNRPKALNAVNATMRDDIHAVLSWFEAEPDLWCVSLPSIIALR